jgi:predicted transglutaminase-like cysteine proteinase
MDKRLLPVLGSLAALWLAPLPAAAAETALPYAISAAAVRKSEALLGSSSRLAALVAQQNGQPLPSPSPAAVAETADAPRSDEGWSLAPQTSLRPGTPDIFGSVALPVEATPLDRRWRAVARRGADRGATRWASSLRDLPEAERIAAVNRFVNARIAFADDQRLFGQADRWQSAAEALRRGRGDCEDYAIAKFQLLRAAGLAERSLYLVIVQDLVRRSDHAILAVESEGRLWVLDNGTDAVADSAEVRDYRPIFTYNASRRWTHGYRRSYSPPLVLAAATRSRPILPAPAAAPAEPAAGEAEPVFSVTADDLAPLLAS